MHLLSQSNVHFRNVDLWTYARDTPVDELINDALINNELQPSVMFFTNQLEENLADYLRFIRFGEIRGNISCLILSLQIFSLYKYGGICLELDVIVRKSMVPLGTNFVGLDVEDLALSSVLSLNQTGRGHWIAEILLS